MLARYIREVIVIHKPNVLMFRMDLRSSLSCGQWSLVLYQTPQQVVSYLSGKSVSGYGSMLFPMLP
jgi:hypothetical protein